MAMKRIKQTAEYSIFQRGDARYAVKDANKQPVNGDEKTRILIAEELIKAAPVAKPAAQEPPVDAADPAEEDSVAEDSVAEDSAE